jgi:hypothetical protein
VRSARIPDDDRYHVFHELSDDDLELVTLLEGELVLAVAMDSPLGPLGEVTLAELGAADWVASPRASREPGFGVWPALPSRPRMVHRRGTGSRR